MEYSRKLNRFLGEFLGLEHLFADFSDIRTNPTISLRTILCAVFLMPFFCLRSMLALDALARKCSFKRLFGCTRTMVVSDSTVARVLTWLKPTQSKRFLRSFVSQFDERELLTKALQPKGQPRRIGIIDGSVMSDHHLVTFSLHGSIDYPVIIENQYQRGKELPTAHRVLNEAYVLLGNRFPDLLLCDSLYFTKDTFKSIRSKGAHLLIKGSNPEFRTVLQEAQFAFENDTRAKTETDRGFDSERLCQWYIEKISGEFAGYPVQIVHLVEDYPKRTKNSHTECWIVTTDLSLSPSEVREAAHLRWHIENHVYKRISHLAGTKRFYFKDPRPFFTMLRLFCTALAAFDAYICILKQTSREFKHLLQAIKPTWKNIFSRLQGQLEEAAFNW